jgi:hypothetical protein
MQSYILGAKGRNLNSIDYDLLVILPVLGGASYDTPHPTPHTPHPTPHTRQNSTFFYAQDY